MSTSRTLAIGGAMAALLAVAGAAYVLSAPEPIDPPATADTRSEQAPAAATSAPLPQPSSTSGAAPRGPGGGPPPPSPDADTGQPPAPPSFMDGPSEEELAYRRDDIMAAADVFVDQLRDRVDLSHDQATALREVMRKERADEFDALHSSEEDGDPGDPRALMQAIRDRSDEAVDEILDEDQRAVYDEMRRPVTADPETEDVSLP